MINVARLTNKQRKFVNEYLIDLNATQAAIRAGYSQKNAFKIGSDLLQKNTVNQQLTKRMQDREARTEITQDKVLNELAAIAFSNGSDFAKVTTKIQKKPVIKMIGKKTVFVFDEKTGEQLFEEYEWQEVEIKNTDDLDSDKKKSLLSIKQGKHGIEVSSYDKTKALELIGKHLGMFTDKVELSGSLAVEMNDDQKKALILKMANKIEGEAIK